jgi:hypothetical protein
VTKGRQPFTLKHLWVKVRQRSTGSNGLTVTAYINGAPLNGRTIAPRSGSYPKVWVERLDYGQTGHSLGVGLGTTVASGGGALWDVEEVTADLDIMPAWRGN